MGIGPGTSRRTYPLAAQGQAEKSGQRFRTQNLSHHDLPRRFENRQARHGIAILQGVAVSASLRGPHQ